MTKQLIYMIAMTALGTAGTLFYGTYWAAFAYFHYAVLRPQFFWAWSLPFGVEWSFYVAVPALIGALARWGETSLPGRNWTSVHGVALLFYLWMVVSYLNALNQNLAYPWLIVNLKIGLMIYIGSVLLATRRQVWWIYLMTTATLGYIGYEANFFYFIDGRMTVRTHGLCGYDNNTTGLMLAMGVPLCLFAWEGLRGSRWRWLFLALVPVLIHTVLLSFSRGAMLSLLIGTPWSVWRSRYRLRTAATAVAFAAVGIPLMAGPEVEQRFFSINKADADASAQSRFSTWGAAYKIAKDYPVFGVGVRNSNALVGRYGNSFEYQTIHSQYLQVLADYGFPGLGLYLTLLGTTFVAILRARRGYLQRTDSDSEQAVAMLRGVECSMVVFCVGAVFLSLETFEVTYILIMVAARLLALSRASANASGPADSAAGPATLSGSSV